MLSKKNLKIIGYIVLFLLLVFAFFTISFITIDGKKIKEIKEFIGTDTKVLYITKNIKLKYPSEILEKYSIDYKTIDSNKLSFFEQNKLKSIINNDNLKNILIIYENGNIKDVLIEYKSKKSVNKFLQENNIIPSDLVENVNEIMEESLHLLDSAYSMVYIPYKKVDRLEEQDQIFNKIAKKYSVDYKRIDAYLLSDNQQEKINNLLGLSIVEDQILILIKDNKMIANIRGIHSKNTYLETLYDVNFINELEIKINDIDYTLYKELLTAPNKSVILISSNNKESERVKEILNKLIYNYNIEINNLTIDSSNEYLYKKVKDKLEKLGYEGGFSTPILIIVESNKLLDYIIGNSKEEYFVDILIENGVIKGDVINE